MDSLPIPPLQYGDLASLGLASGWTPAGWIRWSFELLNVSTGLPWFYTIVLGTILWRVIQLPVAVQAIQTTSRLNLIKPQFEKLTTEIREIPAKNLMAKQMKIRELQRLQEKVGFRPFVALRSPFIQLMIQLGLFFGIQKLCRFPVIQLTQSGFPWVPDLTVADPTWVLPVISFAAMRLAIHVGPFCAFIIL